MNDSKTYYHRPIEVDAIQLTADNYDEVVEWLSKHAPFREWTQTVDEEGKKITTGYSVPPGGSKNVIKVISGKGLFFLRRHGWVGRYPNGTLFAYSNNIFTKNYMDQGEYEGVYGATEAPEKTDHPTEDVIVGVVKS